MSRNCPDVVGKSIWPELVGFLGSTAVTIIERENPTVEANIVRPGSNLTQDIRCDRVRVFVDARGIVRSVPVVQ